MPASELPLPRWLRAKVSMLCTSLSPQGSLSLQGGEARQRMPETLLCMQNCFFSRH